jgi:arylformamidase
MNIILDTDRAVREFDAASPIDISIPLRFNGPQPNAYGVEPATSEPCEYGTLVGDTRRGGSCNFERYTFIPHCNGTHTECIGHITNERISVRECLQDAFLAAKLISVKPTGSKQTEERYFANRSTDDMLITRSALSTAIGANRTGIDALIVRTLPNEDGKLIQSYQGTNVPPYFTTEAMQFIVESGVRHLLVDLPSIDRLYDEGKLSNHRIFWNVEPGSFEKNRSSRNGATITELIYVPDEARDGEYLLNLQIAPFEADCSPSRPLLFGI